MRELYEKVAAATSRNTTGTYSTSFSIGIYCIHRRLREPIYGIYGFVRLADEIVDTFHDQNQQQLLEEFKHDTYQAIDRKFSLNPVLHSFQKAVHQYGIDREMIDCFLKSMEMDLSKKEHNVQSYEEYILGSAEVVGLMCLLVFTEGNRHLYEQLKPFAMSLGSAFQKVNFLRDVRQDYFELGRVYFPEVNMDNLDEKSKGDIEVDIDADFRKALSGIRMLPTSSRLGVYVAYIYYRSLFSKIRKLSSKDILRRRVRISNPHKFSLLVTSYFRTCLNML